MDAIDVGFVRVSAEVTEGAAKSPASLSDLRMELVAGFSTQWPPADRAAVMSLIHHPEEVTLQQVGRANMRIGTLFGEAVLAACAHTGIDINSLDAIASHGQTVFHDPPFATTQLGDGNVIALTTGVTTVSDFRVADVAAGGNGAPLTSTMDALLMAPDNLPLSAPATHAPGGRVRWRAVQNIGGIGNVTLVPPRGTPGLHPIAFDTGPGNCLIDMAAGRCAREAAGAADGASAGSVPDPGAHSFDKDGHLAAAGVVVQPLLEAMLAHPYLARPPPKTTGRELYTQALLDQWWDQGVALGATGQDIVATMTEYTARTIVDAYTRFCPGPVGECVVGGGGSRNPVLMARLAALCSAAYGGDIPVVTHEALGLSSEFKETMAFALLGFLTLHRAVGNVPSCTGAGYGCALGKVCWGVKGSRAGPPPLPAVI